MRKTLFKKSSLVHVLVERTGLTPGFPETLTGTLQNKDIPKNPQILLVSREWDSLPNFKIFFIGNRSKNLGDEKYSQ